MLATKLIQNIRRSGDQSEDIAFQVGFNTSDATLEKLEIEMRKFVENNKKHYVSLGMSISNIDLSNKLMGSFSLQYKGNV
jgi:small-conductance mechanosensitive channel